LDEIEFFQLPRNRLVRGIGCNLMARKLPRIALIGCGVNMQWHARRIASTPEAQIVALVDPNPDSRTNLREKAAITPNEYEDHRELLKKEDLDAVFISTPHAHHFVQVRDALNAGCHVIVEKPLTTTSSDAAKLLRLAEKKERYLMVSYQRLQQNAYMYGAELIAKGKIGEVRGVSCYITQRWARGGWRVVPELSGGGFLFDTGSHLIASTLDLTGLTPVKVQATIDNDGMPVDFRAVLGVEFENGAIGGLTFLGNTKRHEEIITIHGSEGCITFRQSEWKMREVLMNNEPLTIPARVKGRAPSKVLFDWMRTNGKGYSLPWVAVDTIRLTEGAYASAEAGAPVKLKKVRV